MQSIKVLSNICNNFPWSINHLFIFISSSTCLIQTSFIFFVNFLASSLSSFLLVPLVFLECSNFHALPFSSLPSSFDFFNLQNSYISSKASIHSRKIIVIIFVAYPCIPNITLFDKTSIELDILIIKWPPIITFL